MLPIYYSFLSCSSCFMGNSHLNLDCYKGQSLTDKIMRMWIHIREKLVHDYSLVGYMLSPIPAIMEHCAANRTASLSDASECLIEKLILDPGLVVSQRSSRMSTGILQTSKASSTRPIFGLWPVIKTYRGIVGTKNILLIAQMAG
jgi:hypothetical protein